MANWYDTAFCEALLDLRAIGSLKLVEWQKDQQKHIITIHMDAFPFCSIGFRRSFALDQFCWNVPRLFSLLASDLF